eukprot:gene168-288_t
MPISALNHEGYSWIHSKEAPILAFVFAFLSIIISALHITRHLWNYTMPGIQKYVIRIILICPVYAVSSALALGITDYAPYTEIFRDMYEAFVIYSFLNLILEYCGGETDCIYRIENDPDLVLPFPFCLTKPMPRDARLMRFCHRGVLQFVIIKPVIGVLDCIMIATGLYFHRAYQLFEMSVYNISYTWALFCLYVFYLATKQIIKGFRPSLLVKSAPVSVEDGYLLNDLILCCEMLIFSIALLIAFPISEFKGGLKDSGFFFTNVSSILTVRDVVQDVYHNFTPAYQHYALQRSDHETIEMFNAKSHLSGNLDSVAQEMSQRYRGPNRGDKTIRATLRKKKQQNIDHYYNNSTGKMDSHGNGDIENSLCVYEDSEGEGESDGGSISDSTHNLIKRESEGRRRDTQSQSQYMCESRDNHRSTTGTACSDKALSLPLSTVHGIGIIVSGKGVTVREMYEYPTEEDNMMNIEFMSAHKYGKRDIAADDNDDYAYNLDNNNDNNISNDNKTRHDLKDQGMGMSTSSMNSTDVTSIHHMNSNEIDNTNNNNNNNNNNKSAPLIINTARMKAAISYSSNNNNKGGRQLSKSSIGAHNNGNGNSAADNNSNVHKPIYSSIYNRISCTVLNLKNYQSSTDTSSNSSASTPTRLTSPIYYSSSPQDINKIDDKTGVTLHVEDEVVEVAVEVKTDGYDHKLVHPLVNIKLDDNDVYIEPCVASTSTTDVTSNLSFGNTAIAAASNTTSNTTSTAATTTPTTTTTTTTTSGCFNDDRSESLSLSTSLSPFQCPKNTLLSALEVEDVVGHQGPRRCDLQYEFEFECDGSASVVRIANGDRKDNNCHTSNSNSYCCVAIDTGPDSCGHRRSRMIEKEDVYPDIVDVDVDVDVQQDIHERHMVEEGAILTWKSELQFRPTPTSICSYTTANSELQDTLCVDRIISTPITFAFDGDDDNDVNTQNNVIETATMNENNEVIDVCIMSSIGKVSFKNVEDEYEVEVEDESSIYISTETSFSPCDISCDTWINRVDDCHNDDDDGYFMAADINDHLNNIEEMESSYIDNEHSFSSDISVIETDKNCDSSIVSIDIDDDVEKLSCNLLKAHEITYYGSGGYVIRLSKTLQLKWEAVTYVALLLQCLSVIRHLVWLFPATSMTVRFMHTLVTLAVVPDP